MVGKITRATPIVWCSASRRTTRRIPAKSSPSPRCGRRPTICDSDHAVQRHAPGDGLEERRTDDPLREGRSQRFPGPARPNRPPKSAGGSAFPKRQPANSSNSEHPAGRRLEWIELYSLLRRRVGGMRMRVNSEPLRLLFLMPHPPGAVKNPGKPIILTSAVHSDAAKNLVKVPLRARQACVILGIQPCATASQKQACRGFGTACSNSGTPPPLP